MRRILFTGTFCLLNFFSIYAQWANNVSAKEYKEYLENVENYLQNIYYNQIAEAMSNLEAHRYIIEDIMAEDATKYKPELLLEKDKHRFLSPSQYLMQISHAFKDIDSNELEFIVDNLSYSKKIEPYNLSGCYLKVEYDLTVNRNEQILLKRRCRMYCLFPQAIYKSRIKVLQIEPIADIYLSGSSNNIPSNNTYKISASNAERYNEAMMRSKQENNFTSKASNKSIPNTENNTNSLENIVILASKGDITALYNLGNRYEFGIGVAQNYQKAMEYFTKAANKGHAEAAFCLGYFYEYGRIGSPDLEKAEIWYKKAANQGHEAAIKTLKRLIPNIDNKTNSLENIVNLASKGDITALYNLGNRYEFGIGVAQNYQKAMEYFTKAANKGHAEAAFCLGYFYEYGRIGSPDLEKAEIWYKKAANQGHEAAIKTLKRLIPNTDNKTNSLEHIVNLASKGDITALYNLGNRYEFGIGVAQNYQKAMEYFTKAANKGHAEAAFCLGYFYEYGRIGSPDLEKAEIWYKKAANQGHEAAIKTLKRFKNSFSINDDIKNYQALALNGNAIAQYKLGYYYYSGQGGSRDYYKAVEWYSKAAEQGNVDAQTNLGYCYDMGHGVTRNYTKAVEWYTKAAKQGGANAQYNLAICYEYGKGVSKNLHKAIKLYKDSAIQGNKLASKALIKFCFGVVKAKDNTPVIGASISVKNTTIGTISDIDGNFVLPNAKVGDIIKCDFIGYKTYTAQWDGNFMNIILKEN